MFYSHRVILGVYDFLLSDESSQNYMKHCQKSRICKEKCLRIWIISQEETGLLKYRNIASLNKLVRLVYLREAHDSYSSAGPLSDTTVSREREKCLLCLKYGDFSYKNTWICYRRRLFTPQSRVTHVLLRMRALYLTRLDR